MTDTNTNQTTTYEEIIEKAGVKQNAFDLSTLVGYRGKFQRGALSSSREETDLEAFDAMMQEIGTGKEKYLAVRDEIRAALRASEQMQKSRKRAHRMLKEADIRGGMIGLYSARIEDRPKISALIRMRRAGKIWSAAQREAERALAA